MATYQDLIAAVQALLGTSAMGAVLQLNSATRERAFEAYVFSLVVRAAQQAGGDVKILGVNTGENPSPIVFRGAPGQMSSRAQDFAYARCTFGDDAFEIHVDVQYQGTSMATHEIDVSVFDATRAELMRAWGALPGARNLRGALECKFYDSALGTGLGRAFVGLVHDCGELRLNGFASNGRSDGLARYFSQKNRPQPFFDLSPLRPDTVNRFVNTIEQSIRKWLAV